MNDEEKSVLLAKLCGWIRPAGDEYLEGLWIIETPHPMWTICYWREEPTELPGLNFYDSKYMSIAWEIMNWALTNFNIPNHFFQLREIANGMNIFTLSPFQAQCTWLDKILELAIEAKMIQGANVAP